MKQRYYICIDIKSFYASVECVARGLDPMTARLVVADPDRSSNTICLAVSPAMKKLGVKNRCRMGDIPPGLDCIVAKPRMQMYIDCSAAIYGIYLSYFSKDDIHVYSVDEAFMDVTDYTDMYHADPRELGRRIMGDISRRIGVQSTCGIGTNLYLAKIALDIMAKHSPGFIGELDEERYRRMLWDHEPLTDFWRIGRGTQARLALYGIHTMRQIAQTDEDFLYRLFGVNAELLIDHAWGREPVTMADIKNYRSKSRCLSSGQVLMHDYSYDGGLLIVKEMMDGLCAEMLKEGLVTATISLMVGYSGADFGSAVGGHGFDNGTISVTTPTNASSVLVGAVTQLYGRITDRSLKLRRIGITCCNVTSGEMRQLDFFQDTDAVRQELEAQRAAQSIRERFGPNALLRGIDLEDGAMTAVRNEQIGGHHK